LEGIERRLRNFVFGWLPRNPRPRSASVDNNNSNAGVRGSKSFRRQYGVELPAAQLARFRAVDYHRK